MWNNAIYLPAKDLKEVSDALWEHGSVAASPAISKVAAFFEDLAQRYPEDTFKLKLILALNAFHEKGSTP